MEKAIEQKGIENLYKVLELIIEAGNIAEEISQKSSEGTFKWYDRWLFPLVRLGDEAAGLFTIKFKEIYPEFKDLTSAEKEELVTRMKEKFDIANKELEIKVEAAFIILFKVEDIIVELIELAKSFKKK